MNEELPKKEPKTSIIGLIIIIGIIVIATACTMIFTPSTYVYSYDRDENETSSKNDSSNDKLNTSYLKISGVTVSSNSSYTKCQGTITVSSYSPYKYHYIKVKGAFKTSGGTTVDTDWTYAIGSEWLEPGESTKFVMSVDKDSSISNCTVTIMED